MIDSFELEAVHLTDEWFKYAGILLCMIHV